MLDAFVKVKTDIYDTVELHFDYFKSLHIMTNQS